MGTRTVTGLSTKIDYLHERGPAGEVVRYIFTPNDDSGYSWQLKMPAEYTRLVETHRQLDKLNRPANKDVVLDFEGVIVDLAVSYDRAAVQDGRVQLLSNAKIKIDSVVPLHIKTPYSSGELGMQIRAIQERVKKAYEEYMNSGFDQPVAGEPSKRPPTLRRNGSKISIETASPPELP